MSRFDYSQYDVEALCAQNSAKLQCITLEKLINEIGSKLDPITDKACCGRAKALALTKLEEVYMWIGKAIRDDLVCRKAATKLNE